MSYANPLNQRRREPIAAQGEITGKAFLDTMELADRRENAADAFLLATSYPGGENDHNFSVMPGEMVFGLRKRGSDFMSSGEPNEFGMTSMAGLNWGRYKSLDHCMRDYYFIGLAKTEFRVGNADQPEHGFATIRAGSYSTINNGARDIHAGDLVGYTFPITRREGYKSDRSQKLMPYNATGDSMDRIVPQNRGGTPNTKYLPELTPFDYTDFTTSLSGALVGMPWPMAEGGSADCDYKDFWDVNELRNRPLTNMAEEQMGYKFGLVGAVLRGMEYLLANIKEDGSTEVNPDNAKAAKIAATMAEAIGIFRFDAAKAKDQHWYKMLCAIFGEYHRDLTGFNAHRDAHTTIMSTANPATKEVHRKYLQLTRTCMQTLCSGIASSWYHMSTRVIGRAMNRCRQTETAHIVLGHFRRL